MDDIIKTIEDFKEINWSKVSNSKADNKTWTFGRGGHGLDNKQWTVGCLIDDKEDFHSIIYPLPEFLNDMVNLINKWGRDEANQEVSNFIRKFV